MPLLRLSAVTRRFSGSMDVKALDGVSLDVDAGEFVTIVGPSGGGKSTLLNVIGLLDAPDDGIYEIDGTDTASWTPRRQAAERSDRFAFVFQGFHLLDRRPVTDSVELGLLYRGVPTKARRDAALTALRQVGLEEFADQTAAKLSGGQRQRVAIARAIATGSPVLVADEPTGNLDSATGARIVSALEALRDQGMTIVLVTHDEQVARHGDRTVRVLDGKVERVDRQRRIAPAVPTSRTAAAGRVLPEQRLGAPSRVRGRDVLRDAIRSVLSRPGRSIGLIFAVATAVALAVTTLGLAVSAGAQVSDRFNRHTNRDVTLSWSPAPEDGSTTSRSSVTPGTLTSLLKRVRAIKGVSSASVLEDRGSSSVQATPVRPAFRTDVYSSTGPLSDAARMHVDWLDGARHTLGRDEVLLGRGLATELSLGPEIGNVSVRLNDEDVEVVGVIQSSPRIPALMGAVISGTDAPQGVEPASRTRLLIRTDAGAAQQVAKQSPWATDPAHAEAVNVDAPTDPTALRQQVEGDVQVTLLAFTGVAVLAAIAALTNAIILAVLERRSEIGLRRAIGARPPHIAALILTESLLMGAAGGLVGLFLGVASILVVTLSRHWVPVLDPTAAPLALLGGIAVGALGGTAAAIRASRIAPHEALRL